MTVTKSKYWAVVRIRDKAGLRPKQAVYFEGTFKECWTYLTENFSTYTLQMLENDGYQITRHG